MAARTWNISITPPAGIPPQQFAVSVHYLTGKDAGEFVIPVLDEARAVGALDSAGSVSLTFDDQPYPDTIWVEDGKIVMYLSVFHYYWDFWLFGPYDEDGNPILDGQE